MGDVLFVWTAAYQTCLMRACVPRLLSLIKHVLTVWPLTSTLACLVTKQCLMGFGRQTFIVCPGPKNNKTPHRSTVAERNCVCGIKNIECIQS